MVHILLLPAAGIIIFNGTVMMVLRSNYGSGT